VRDLRGWCVANFVWLFALYNIERVTGPLGLAPFLYPLTVALSLALVAVPRLHDWSRTVLAIVAAGFLTAKLLLGQEIWGAAFSVTSLEVLALGMTTTLGAGFGRLLAEFSESSHNLTIQHLQDRSASFEAEQGRIFQEIRRARRNDRPAALLTFSVDPDEVVEQSDRLMLDVQRTNLKRYVTTRIGELLSQELNGSAIITRRNGHFVTLLPETRKEEVTGLLQRLSDATKRELGVTLHAGSASFPDEEITFARLLERAEGRMWTPRPEAPVPQEAADPQLASVP